METNLDKTKLVIWRKLSASPLTFNYIEVPICNFRITPCRLCLSNLVIFLQKFTARNPSYCNFKTLLNGVLFFGGGGRGGELAHEIIAQRKIE